VLLVLRLSSTTDVDDGGARDAGNEEDCNDDASDRTARDAAAA
jgi:hypothetical protein